MNNLWTTVQNGLWNLIHRPGLVDILDILIVAFLVYKLLEMMQQTRSSGALKGLVLFFVAAFLSSLAGLTALNWLLMTILNNGVLVIVMLFQPELRAALERLGRAAGGRVGGSGHVGDERSRIVDEITQCVLDLSARKVGALIVIEQKTGLQDVIDTGTRLDARISAPLLENIFEPKTPLHDGAVVLRADRVMAAACILRLTENTAISRELGTRHRAAIGITENSDAQVLVVSEETGIISLTNGGVITRRMSERDIRKVLTAIYVREDDSLMARVRRLFRKGKEAA